MQQNNKKIRMNHAHAGSLLVSLLVSLLLLNTLLMVGLRNAIIFSNLCLKRQHYVQQFYAADALAQNGVNYVISQCYLDQMPVSTNGIDFTRTLTFSSWPPLSHSAHLHGTQLMGTIVLSCKENNKENNVLIEATIQSTTDLKESGSCVVHCTLARSKDFYRISDWSHPVRH